MKSVQHRKRGWPAGIMTLALAMGILVFLLANGVAGARKSSKSGSFPQETQLTPEKLATLDSNRPTITYDSLGRQDPFRPFFDLTHIERSIPSDPSRPRTPLEKFALNQYHLVGIMLAGKEHNYALVEDPEHVGHTVHVGDMIGNQSGIVKAINDNEVIVEEPYLDIFDQRQTRTIVIRLHSIEEQNLSPLLPDNSQDILPPESAKENAAATVTPIVPEPSGEKND